MIKEAENNVRIEGLLSEVDLKYGSFKKKTTGEQVNSIGGSIKVQVNQNVNGETVMLEVPVHMFASEYTNNGKKNPAYQNMEKIMNEFTSIAVAGNAAQADAVRITNGKIVSNDFPNRRTGEISSYPRINASFVSKIRQDEMKPEATFTATFVVGKKAAEVDKDGIETGRYKVTGVLPQYGGKVDVIEFLTTNKKVIEAIDQYWNENDTVSAIGRLNFSSRTETVVKEVDFGEAQEMVRTFSVSELILTGGSATPLEGDRAYDINEIKEALAERKERLEKMKEENAASTSKTRNAPAADSKGRVDLGF